MIRETGRDQQGKGNGNRRVEERHPRRIAHRCDSQKQFEDNRLHFSDTPEKQNLYNALANIATELQYISAALQRLEQAVAQLSRR